MLSHFANAAGKFDVERETSVLAQRSCQKNLSYKRNLVHSYWKLPSDQDLSST